MLGSSPAHAADPARADAEIVVTGRHAQPRTVLSETRAISATHDGQLARFETAICPVVAGVPPAYAATIEQRIRETAVKVGLRVGAGGCVPNLSLIIAGDGRALIDLMLRKRPMLFDDLSAPDLRRLTESPGPSWSWQSVTPRTRDGGPTDAIRGAKNAYTTSIFSASRLNSPVRQDTEAAFVVIEAGAIAGLSLAQVGDYAAIAGLAAIRTQRLPSLSQASILTMFDDLAQHRAPPPELTVFDLGYLRGLYAGASGVSADSKTAMIAGRIEQRRGADGGD